MNTQQVTEEKLKQKRLKQEMQGRHYDFPLIKYIHLNTETSQTYTLTRMKRYSNAVNIFKKMCSLLFLTRHFHLLQTQNHCHKTNGNTDITLQSEKFPPVFH
jgi:hypothetical protein